MFGGVERESSRTFLVPVLDRTADTLTGFIRAWIEPSTTLISDCWTAYQDIVSHGYMHCTVNHSILFVNPDTGDHTNTIECTWRHVKVFLGSYHRQKDYEFILPTTCLWRGARHRGCLISINFLPSPHPPTGPPADHLSPLGQRHVTYSCASL